MAKERILSEIVFNLEAQAINVKWIDRFTEDGELISERIHRGAYPVDANNEVDDSVKTLLGASLQDIIGEAAAGSQRELHAVKSAGYALAIEADNLRQQVDQLNSAHETRVKEVQMRDALIEQLTNELARVKSENEQLKAESET